jgi:hypothetical protein
MLFGAEPFGHLPLAEALNLIAHRRIRTDFINST